MNELEIVKMMIKNKGNVPSPPGIWINKKNYHLINIVEDNKITCYLKTEKGGAAVIQTKKLILIGIWEEKKQAPGECNIKMDEFANNFITNGY